MSHVPRKKSLPIAKGGQAKPQGRPTFPTKPQEKDASVFLQTMPRVAHDKHAPLHDRGCRELMCAFIRQTVADVDAKTDFVDPRKNAEWELHKISAIHFMRSPFFESLCRTLRLPTDKIRRAAFK